MPSSWWTVRSGRPSPSREKPASSLTEPPLGSRFFIPTAPSKGSPRHELLFRLPLLLAREFAPGLFLGCLRGSRSHGNRPRIRVPGLIRLRDHDDPRRSDVRGFDRFFRVRLSRVLRSRAHRSLAIGLRGGALRELG